MRLIDADALKENLLGEWYVELNETIFNHVFDLIDNAPTVEQKYYERVIAQINPVIEARPQGEWHYYNNSNVNGYIHDGCKCREEVFDYAYKFCPNCGADMRGEKE